MLVKLNEQSMQNLILFLDRVNFKGHKERQAMNEIEMALLNPIPDQPLEEGMKNPLEEITAKEVQHGAANRLQTKNSRPIKARGGKHI